jgi:hypothetical protein
VFALETGRVKEARERYRRAILPAVPRGQALTDAPSLLWRLFLGGAVIEESDWAPVRDAALARVGDRASDPYLELHHLLALAAGRELGVLDRWLDAAVKAAHSPRRRSLLRLAWALRTFANRDYRAAAKLLDEAPSLVSLLGGSAAQNRLFARIAERAGQLGGPAAVSS